MNKIQRRGAGPYILVLFALCSLSLFSCQAWSEPLPSSGGPKAAEVIDNKFLQAVRSENGEGVARDYLNALKLYCEAADEGDTRSFFSIGWMYFIGRGVPRDDTVAQTWFRKAAAQGVKQAITLSAMLGSVQPSDRTGCPSASPKMPEVLPVPQGSPLTPPAAIRSIVEQIAGKYGLDVALVYAVIAAESNFDVLAESDKHAKGLMQLLPETAARFGVKDIFDPTENIRGGMTYLCWLIKHFSGNLDLALAAYNAGEGTVHNFGGIPPYTETVNYLARIKRYYPYQNGYQAKVMP